MSQCFQPGIQGDKDPGNTAGFQQFKDSLHADSQNPKNFSELFQPPARIRTHLNKLANNTNGMLTQVGTAAFHRYRPGKTNKVAKIWSNSDKQVFKSACLPARIHQPGPIHAPSRYFQV